MTRHTMRPRLALVILVLLSAEVIFLSCLNKLGGGEAIFCISSLDSRNEQPELDGHIIHTRMVSALRRARTALVWFSHQGIVFVGNY